MWLVAELSRNVKLLQNDGQVRHAPATWAEGMVGVMPVFETLADVQAYAGKSTVQAFEIQATGRPGVPHKLLKLVPIPPN